ncbi:MAG: DUF1850 domain-containing protein [Chloroflexi bacterium]|nr:DUF1850 domain-containing protein [Chloroflexota bacterium]
MRTTVLRSARLPAALRGQRAVLVVLVLVLSVAAAFAAAAPRGGLTLTVADADTGRLLWRRHAAAGDMLTLSYTHSIYGGRVWETHLLAASGVLELSGMETETGGAAEYYATDGAFVRAPNGRYRLTTHPRRIETLRLRVDAIGQPRLDAGGETLDLLALLGSSGSVIVQASGG